MDNLQFNSSKQYLNELQEKYIVTLKRYQRLLHLLKLEQDNTQKFMDLFEESQKHNCELKQKIKFLSKKVNKEALS